MGVRALRTVPCATCGRLPTGIFSDGSPRYDHGHDRATGETWWAQAGVTSGGSRRCPACSHDHPAGTTCLECAECQALDLTPMAREVFTDLLPGGADAQAALERHNRNLGRTAACDGSCGLAGCRRPYFDRAGLTRYLDGLVRGERMVTASAEPIVLPVEDDYPRSAWEVTDG